MTGTGGPGPAPGADEQALRLLTTAYASAVDELDGDGLAELFVPDGELVVPNFPEDLRPVVTRAGHDALRKVPEGLQRYACTFHLLSGHRFAIVGDAATGVVQCVAHHLLATRPAADAARGGGPGTDLVWFIRYADEYRRTGSGWKFVRRELHLQWVEEHPVTVLGLRADSRGAR
ncbi:MAG TPA: nuclear transport factor 2 family protein [Acidimicrobiales bacterium]